MDFIIIDENTPPLTEEELQEVKEASKRPYIYDEDAPELTDEQLKKLHRVASPAV